MCDGTPCRQQVSVSCRPAGVQQRAAVCSLGYTDTPDLYPTRSDTSVGRPRCLGGRGQCMPAQRPMHFADTTGRLDRPHDKNAPVCCYNPHARQPAQARVWQNSDSEPFPSTATPEIGLQATQMLCSVPTTSARRRRSISMGPCMPGAALLWRQHHDSTRQGVPGCSSACGGADPAALAGHAGPRLSAGGHDLELCSHFITC